MGVRNLAVSDTFQILLALFKSKFLLNTQQLLILKTNATWTLKLRR